VTMLKSLNSGPSAPKIAYFIMVHHKPAQFDWLLRAIYDPADLFLVHVDAKSRLGLKRDRSGVMQGVRDACAGKPNVRLMRSRFTNWGGWSLSQALLDAIAIALKADSEWRYFVNLSGQCYPLKPMDVVKREMDQRGDIAHVQMRPIETLPSDDWHHRAHPMFETPIRAFILPGRKKPPHDFAMSYKGSQWTVLPRSFCEWIVSSATTRRVSAYLKGLLLSDELIMQTLVENSPYRDRVADHYGREILWPGPKLLTMEDLPLLEASPAWFGRKFDAEVDPAVLLALADANGFVPGGLTELAR